MLGYFLGAGAGAGALLVVGTGPTAPDSSSLLQYGAVGLIAAIGMWVSWNLYRRLEGAYRREQQRGDRLEEELRRLNQATQDLMTGALRDATAAVAEAITVISGDANARNRLPAPRRRPGEH